MYSFGPSLFMISSFFSYLPGDRFGGSGKEGNLVILVNLVTLVDLVSRMHGNPGYSEISFLYHPGERFGGSGRTWRGVW